ncbi:hypothetical protein Fcan01_19111 [Folsomia candida]|uniref:Uncharacterized protein n=1 Tax=Folsomia candida TaxID=158441 RepID=A0A226DL83_FOLCA|nr:hypothetical protein Fcan01_19111 [Folsomia candida]
MAIFSRKRVAPFLFTPLFFHSLDDGVVCLQIRAWMENDFQGNEFVPQIDRTGVCINVPDAFNDQISSLIADDCVQIWRDFGCVGEGRQIAQTTQVARLSDFNFNDVTSSVSFC